MQFIFFIQNKNAIYFQIGSLIKELGFEKNIKEESSEQIETKDNNNNNNDDDNPTKKESPKESIKKTDKKKKGKDKNEELKKGNEIVSIKEDEINFDIDEILKKYPLATYDKILLKDCVPWHDQVTIFIIELEQIGFLLVITRIILLFSC